MISVGLEGSRLGGKMRELTLWSDRCIISYKKLLTNIYPIYYPTNNKVNIPSISPFILSAEKAFFHPSSSCFIIHSSFISRTRAKILQELISFRWFLDFGKHFRDNLVLIYIFMWVSLYFHTLLCVKTLRIVFFPRKFIHHI